jgi:putative GTP pyrophosphokinase
MESRLVATKKAGLISRQEGHEIQIRTLPVGNICLKWVNKCGKVGSLSPWRLALANIKEPTYPGGSKERVRRAGNNVRAGTATPDDYAVIDLWRAAHRPVLNTFQAILRTRTRGKNIVVARRHKRKRTIFNKLTGFSSMQLHRMDDVAGCRLIFDNIEELCKFHDKLHKARFNHLLKNYRDKYDYIKAPNPRTGYRGVHDVYEYAVNSISGAPYKRLFIEVQYRTKYQHAWATCVEVIGFITESQPKFQQGDTRFQNIIEFASEIIARVFEKRKSNHPDMSDGDLVKRFLSLDNEIGFIKKALNLSDREISTKKNLILIFSENGKLETLAFRDATDALRALFKLESESPEKDVVLVRADTSDEIRVAFKNYFSDARDFVELIEEGCEKLAGKMVIHTRTKQAGKSRGSIADRDV